MSELVLVKQGLQKMAAELKKIAQKETSSDILWIYGAPVIAFGRIKGWQETAFMFQLCFNICL